MRSTSLPALGIAGPGLAGLRTGWPRVRSRSKSSNRAVLVLRHQQFGLLLQCCQHMLLRLLILSKETCKSPKVQTHAAGVPPHCESLCMSPARQDDASHARVAAGLEGELRDITTGVQACLQSGEQES